MEDRKCCIRIGGGLEGGHATDAICGRRVWKRCRVRESGLVSGWNSCVMESWSWEESRSLCSLNPFVALWIAAAMVMTKSGAARVRGQGRPRPPARRLSWLMRMAWLGVEDEARRVVRNSVMISSMADVSGPFHCSQLGFGSSVGRL